jgi:ribosomal protein L37AE/L43A
MLRPSNKRELAGIKDKNIICESCGNSFIIEKAVFGPIKCSKCGSEIEIKL